MNHSKPLCILKVSEVPLHLYQLISGFMILKKQGIIDLKIEESTKKIPYNMMEVNVNNQLRVLYDANDGYDNLIKNGDRFEDFYDKLLKEYDICFKRSFSKEYNKKLTWGNKIKPLGLNYMVTIRKNWAHNIYKLDPKAEKIKKIIRKFPFSMYYNNKYLVETFEEKPVFNANPKILFIARLWNPEGEELSGLPQSKIDERKEINEIRIKCIEACKKEFGDNFIGGITPSEYARKKCNHLIINDKKITNRDGYLKIMKNCDICIATTGLHESIGWKFGEYVAASKAIITEKLHYELPGKFRKNINYLEFDTVESCINNIYKLINDKDKRYRMMKNNYEYYKKYVKPDKLILNTLKECIEIIESKKLTEE